MTVVNIKRCTIPLDLLVGERAMHWPCLMFDHLVTHTMIFGRLATFMTIRIAASRGMPPICCLEKAAMEDDP